MAKGQCNTKLMDWVVDCSKGQQPRATITLSRNSWKTAEVQAKL
jgi:hypothetical protein